MMKLVGRTTPGEVYLHARLPLLISRATLLPLLLWALLCIQLIFTAASPTSTRDPCGEK